MLDRSNVMTQMKWDILVLCLRLPTSPHEKVHVEKTSEMPQGEVKNRRRSGYKEKDDFGTWNVQTLFQAGALISSLSQQISVYLT